MLINGECIEEIKKMDDNSVDSIVTDPPYELGFMNKKWDNTGIAYNVELWTECLRVLKPGGHLLAFGGSRTYHRMTCAIEDAGFEIRDMIEWMYSSGFPKSNNISKSIDKMKGAKREVFENPRWKELYPNGPGGSGGSFKQLDKNKMCNPLLTSAPSTPEAIKWDGWGSALKPAHEIVCQAQKPFKDVPLSCTIDSTIKHIGGQLCQLPSFVKIAKENSKLNQKGQKQPNIAQWIVEENTNSQDVLLGLMDTLQLKSMENLNLNIVLSWLKVLEELYYLQNKYTISTRIEVITELKILQSLEWQNILQDFIHHKDSKINGLCADADYAISLLNVVGLKLKGIRCVIAQENATKQDSQLKLSESVSNEPICMARKPIAEKTIAKNVLKYGTGGINIDECRVAKRFPANIIHDGSDEVIECFPNSKSDGGKGKISMNTDTNLGGGNNYFNYGDSGSAARFFYCAKSSKTERNMGCDDNTNIHPTIKAIKLMRYLCKLVTPPNGTVLDPFMGSGSTGMAAIQEGFNFIGIEKENEYYIIANKRIEYATKEYESDIRRI